MRFVDLSLRLEPSPSEFIQPTIEYQDHQSGAQQMAAIFGVAPQTFPGGLGWATEQARLHTHAGTHMDAPWHYAPVAGDGAAPTIDEIPLQWCFAPGVVLDCRSLPKGAEIEVAHLEAELARIGHTLTPGDIVLLYTATDQYWGRPDYAEMGCGLNRASTLWLIERGVKIIGTDAWGLDRPFGSMRTAYQQSGDAGSIWSAHFAGREAPYCQLEKLTNLGELPPHGFTVACFPVKLAKASAAWCRVVALVP